MQFAILPAWRCRASAAAAWTEFGRERSAHRMPSYSFRDRPLDAAIEGFAAVGLRGCELWQGHLEPKTRAREAAGVAHFRSARRDLGSAREKLDKAGIDAQRLLLQLPRRHDRRGTGPRFLFRQGPGRDLHHRVFHHERGEAARAVPRKHKMRVGSTDTRRSRTPTNSPARKASRGMALSKYFGVNLDIGHFFAAGLRPGGYIDRTPRQDRHPAHQGPQRTTGERCPSARAERPCSEVLQLLKSKNTGFPPTSSTSTRGRTRWRKSKSVTTSAAGARVGSEVGRRAM